MDISVKDLLSGRERAVNFSFEIPLDHKENDIVFTTGVLVEGKVTDSGGYMELEATCRAQYQTKCARCLKTLEDECSISFIRPVAVKLEQDHDEDEYVLVSDNASVNVDEAVSQELLLSLPFRALCKEDCKGLCIKCGCDLNEKQCSCVTKEIDPRWAVLKNFKPKEQE